MQAVCRLGSLSALQAVMLAPSAAPLSIDFKAFHFKQQLYEL